MAFIALSQNEQDDILLTTLKAQEMDLFQHQANKTRFTEMLKTLPDGSFKVRIEKLAADTDARIAEVQAIVDATVKQLPDQTRIDAAITRINAR